MQGRLLQFQEHPFECKTNYAGSATLRCNFDVQDLRRVLPEEYWLGDEEELPHLGDCPGWGYMNHYERDGNEYVARKRSADADATGQPMRWNDGHRPDD